MRFFQGKRNLNLHLLNIINRINGQKEISLLLAFQKSILRGQNVFLQIAQVFQSVFDCLFFMLRIFKIAGSHFIDFGINVADGIFLQEF